MNMNEFITLHLIDAVEADISATKGHNVQGTVVLPVSGKGFTSPRNIRVANEILVNWYRSETQTLPAWTIESIIDVASRDEAHVYYRLHCPELHTVKTTDDIKDKIVDLAERAGDDFNTGEPLVLDITGASKDIDALKEAISIEGADIDITTTTIPDVIRITITSGMDNVELDNAIENAKQMLYEHEDVFIPVHVGKARDLDFAEQYVRRVFDGFDGSDTVLKSKVINVTKSTNDQAILLTGMGGD